MAFVVVIVFYLTSTIFAITEKKLIEKIKNRDQKQNIQRNVSSTKIPDKSTTLYKPF